MYPDVEAAGVSPCLGGFWGNRADLHLVKRYALGRKVNHDPRSLRYQVAPPISRTTLVSVAHQSKVGSFDQGQVGSCTGNAATKCLTYDPFWAEGTSVLTGDLTADEKYAVGVYSDATQLDSAPGSYPPDDTGSDGLSVAKVLTSRGLISGYQHATSMDALLAALQTVPVIVGTTWREDMFTPAPTGQLKTSGKVAGGHEYVIDQADMDREILWMQNSWGNGWGVRGRAWYAFDDFELLLHDQGDVTVFVPASQPPPKPLDPVLAWRPYAAQWSEAKHSSAANQHMAALTKAYLTSL